MQAPGQSDFLEDEGNRENAKGLTERCTGKMGCQTTSSCVCEGGLNVVVYDEPRRFVPHKENAKQKAFQFAVSR